MKRDACDCQLELVFNSAAPPPPPPDRPPPPLGPDPDDGREEAYVCRECGAKWVEYRYLFNSALGIFLGRLYDAGGPAQTLSLGLNYSQRTNSHKVWYWGLGEQYLTEDTKAKRGWWQITQKGRDFVEGKITIPRYVITRRNVVVRFEGEPIAFSEVSGGYLYRKDYADQVRQQLNGH